MKSSPIPFRKVISEAFLDRLDAYVQQCLDYLTLKDAYPCPVDISPTVANIIFERSESVSVMNSINAWYSAHTISLNNGEQQQHTQKYVLSVRSMAILRALYDFYVCPWDNISDSHVLSKLSHIQFAFAEATKNIDNHHAYYTRELVHQSAKFQHERDESRTECTNQCIIFNVKIINELERVVRIVFNMDKKPSSSPMDNIHDYMYTQREDTMAVFLCKDSVLIDVCWTIAEKKRQLIAQWLSNSGLTVNSGGNVNMYRPVAWLMGTTPDKIASWEWCIDVLMYFVMTRTLLTSLTAAAQQQ